jgi:uracil-DNA glycosylase
VSGSEESGKGSRSKLPEPGSDLALLQSVQACQICAGNLPHGARPVVQFSSASRLLIIGQAPGSKVHASGVPWDDASGARLLEWTGLTRDELYDRQKVAIVPMGFCYPGKGKSGDLPPRKECAPAWHEKILNLLPERRLTLLVGAYAQNFYLPGAGKATMTERVRNFNEFGPAIMPLPHPAWRSTLWMRKNPWFEEDVLPVLRASVAAAIQPPSH